MPDGTRRIADEPLGQRVARLRAEHGWTQQELADRVSLSRVAVSHLELGISVPSERTVTLLAGAFHLEPPALVEGTTYPEAKAERLPLVTAQFTQVELQVALFQRDLNWLTRLNQLGCGGTLTTEVRSQWRRALAELAGAATTSRDRDLLREARALLER